MKASGTMVFAGVAVVTLGAVGMWSVGADQAIVTTPATVAPMPGTVASIHVPAAAIQSVYPDMAVPPCITEDSHDCYWDAAHMGNGRGRSFVNIGGHTYYAQGK